MDNLSAKIGNNFSKKKIVIVGDLVADQFLRGTIAVFRAKLRFLFCATMKPKLWRAARQMRRSMSLRSAEKPF